MAVGRHARIDCRRLANRGCYCSPMHQQQLWYIIVENGETLRLRVLGFEEDSVRSPESLLFLDDAITRKWIDGLKSDQSRDH